MLLVFSGAIVAMCQGEDQGIAALEIAERAHRAEVVRESVVGEGAARSDVRTHRTHGRTRGRSVAPVQHTSRTLAGRGRSPAGGPPRRWCAAAVLDGFPAWWHGSSRAGRTAPGRQARVPARDLQGREGPAPSVILSLVPARR